MTAARIAELSDDEIRRLKWYYSVELRPGVYSHGYNHANIAITRALLARTAVAGMSCLDIGTQEGLFPTLLVRRGAKDVTTIDPADLSDRVALVKEAHGVDFDYLPGMRIEDLRPVVVARDKPRFDVIVCSGVLYHLIDPLGDLVRLRALVRTGGIVIVETEAVATLQPVLFLNASGWFEKSSGTVFIPSVECLDYMLRLVHLKPLDVLFIALGGSQMRIAIACRAVDEAVALPDDNDYMAGFRFDKARHGPDWASLRTGVPEVTYRTPSEGLTVRPETGSVDIPNTVQSGRPYDLRPRETVLALADVM